MYLLEVGSWAKRKWDVWMVFVYFSLFQVPLIRNYWRIGIVVSHVKLFIYKVSI